MSFAKKLEIIIRKSILKIFKIVSRSKTPLPPGIDYNTCKFLFVRQDRIGDLLVSTPLLYALNNRYPRAAIDMLLSSNNVFVLENTPFIRRRWIYRKQVKSIVGLIRDVRKEKYDFVIDLMDNPSATTTALSLCAGGKWNVGLAKQNEYAYDIVIPLRSRKDIHIIERIAELLRVFDIDPSRENLRPRYEISQSNASKARSFISGLRPTKGYLIGINLSAGSETRFWGVDNYRSLIEKLHEEYRDIVIVLLFKNSDENRAQDIALSRSFVNVVPTSSFDQFAAIIQQLDYLITPDTAAVHLASAFQIPSVVLYVQSDKSLRIWDPYRSPSECVVTDVDDLKTIPVSQVYDAAKRLIEKNKRKA